MKINAQEITREIGILHWNFEWSSLKKIEAVLLKHGISFSRLVNLFFLCQGKIKNFSQEK